MPLAESEISRLKKQAAIIRHDIIDTTVWSGGAHIGGALSMVEIILPGELGESVGRSARGGGLYSLCWMLIFFRKHKDRFENFILGYIDGYGRDNLKKRIEAMTTGRDQRSVLKNLGVFDAELRKSILDEIRLKPVNTEDDKDYTLWLLKGVLATGWKRRKRVEMLAAIDEPSLIEFAENVNGRPMKLQRLMQAALWLSPDEARRIATIIPAVLSGHAFKGTAKGWSFLLNNTYSADPPAAERIVDYICTMRFGEFFPNREESCDRMLTAMEKVKPGCVVRWVAEDETNLERGLISGSERDIGDELVTLALFAQESVARAMTNVSVGQRVAICNTGDMFQKHIKKKNH